MFHGSTVATGQRLLVSLYVPDQTAQGITRSFDDVTRTVFALRKNNLSGEKEAKKKKPAGHSINHSN
ncbi:hypothetical protein GCM10023189_38630 [Nibrella saemangeumensis]|uniref:Uncharacterized protein n=1 Tax=Nibrella saemangeumensis TaxID=1084526 RepID=A0ABP8N6K0_9BACT